MPETNKPAWVDALDEAKALLREAAALDSVELSDHKTRLAFAWMDVARLHQVSL